MIIFVGYNSMTDENIMQFLVWNTYLLPDKGFHIVTSDAEEKNGFSKNDAKYSGENVWKYAIDTARLKAEDVFKRATQNSIPNLNESFMVIGSDTIVTYDGKIYGKPKEKWILFGPIYLQRKVMGEIQDWLCLITFLNI